MSLIHILPVILVVLFHVDPITSQGSSSPSPAQSSPAPTPPSGSSPVPPPATSPSGSSQSPTTASSGSSQNPPSGQTAGQLTHFCSYPPCCKKSGITYTSAETSNCDQSECSDDSGCDYQGQLAFCGNKDHDWIVQNNIISFFSTNGDIDKYQGKTFQITQGSNSIQATVCDTCGDSDCGGCCTTNAQPSGYLVDMEANTYARFGAQDGDIQWSCINC